MEKIDKASFEVFLSQVLKTIANLGWFSDFKKCLANVNKIEMELNQLNYLIGKSDLAWKNNFYNSYDSVWVTDGNE